MSLGWNGYLIHGTNAPTTVGMRSSSGCMRMYADDIENLFNNIEIGTKVRVIYEPFKIGVKDGQLYLEAHELFVENYYNINHDDKYDLLEDTVAKINYAASSDIDWKEAKKLINETHGYPVNITGTINARPEQNL